MVRNEPTGDPASTNGGQGRGRVFPAKPTSHPLDFGTELIYRLIPRKIGKLLVIAGSLIASSFSVYEWVQ